MVVRFKPKFWKDINKVKRDGEILEALGKIIKQVEQAKITDEIANFKKLTKYKTRCRIKLQFDKRRDFRTVCVCFRAFISHFLPSIV